MDVGARGSRGSRRAIRCFALLTGLVLAGCASHSNHPSQPAAHASTPTGTVVRTYAAYDASGQLTVEVHDIERGSCWTNSIAAPDDPHAYRCFAGNAILDPCFAPPTGKPTQVACVATPWSQAEVLQLSRPLPSTSPADGNRPWAFQLASGARCVASTGTVGEVAGVNLGYHCSDGNDAALVDAAARQVIADYAAPRATSLQHVAVTTIWRG
jgi:hypothetical protein